MKKAEKIILILFAVAAVVILAVISDYFWGKRTDANATSASSFTEEPIQLQSIRTGDIVICTLRDASGHTTVRRVIWVERRDGKYLRGYEANHLAIKRIVGGLPLSALEKCEIRILRNQTLVREYIGDTILRGKNPGHLHG